MAVLASSRRTPWRRMGIVRLLFSNTTPKWAKILLAAGLLYSVSPIDFVPDFFLGAGQLDDAIVLISTILTFLMSAKDDTVKKNR